MANPIQNAMVGVRAVPPINYVSIILLIILLPTVDMGSIDICLEYYSPNYTISSRVLF